MPKKLTLEDTKQSLNVHVTAKGEELYAKYGPHIGWNELLRILEDRAFVRYPVEIKFSEEGLWEGEFAHPEPRGERPEEGFILYVHPFFSLQREKVSWWVLYQLVLVNYGEFASPDDAETFGATALGMGKEEYYRALCRMADEMQLEE